MGTCVCLFFYYLCVWKLLYRFRFQYKRRHDSTRYAYKSKEVILSARFCLLGMKGLFHGLNNCERKGVFLKKIGKEYGQYTFCYKGRYASGVVISI